MTPLPVGPFSRERIVHLAGELPRVELFARQVVPGWTAWGNELPAATGHLLAPAGSVS